MMIGEPSDAKLVLQLFESVWIGHKEFPPPCTDSMYKLPHIFHNNIYYYWLNVIFDSQSHTMNLMSRILVDEFELKLEQETYKRTVLTALGSEKP